jgi:hypothetical protein
MFYSVYQHVNKLKMFLSFQLCIFALVHKNVQQNIHFDNHFQRDSGNVWNDCMFDLHKYLNIISQLVKSIKDEHVRGFNVATGRWNLRPGKRSIQLNEKATKLKQIFGTMKRPSFRIKHV